MAAPFLVQMYWDQGEKGCCPETDPSGLRLIAIQKRWHRDSEPRLVWPLYSHGFLTVRFRSI